MLFDRTEKVNKITPRTFGVKEADTTFNDNMYLNAATQEEKGHLRECLNKTNFFQGLDDKTKSKVENIFASEQIPGIKKIDKKLGYVSTIDQIVEEQKSGISSD